MITTILIFVVILGVLVLVHEFGHFIVAKKSGMVVHEFGFGFPPRLVGIKRVNGKYKIIFGHQKSVNDQVDNQTGQAPSDTTIYSINAIPIGGFVRIMGENNEHQEDPRSFINKPFWPRFFTLVAGVVMNVVLAWVLISGGFMFGIPVAVESKSDLPASAKFSNPNLVILSVLKDSPAEKAGVLPSDNVMQINGQGFNTVTEMRDFIIQRAGQTLDFKVERQGRELNLPVETRKDYKPEEGAAGIELGLVGNLSFPPHIAIWQGAKTTAIKLVGVGQGVFQLITGRLGFDSVGGPVKIAQLVGQAREYGFFPILNLTIVLSLSLAVLNILPFPALDGGRVLFLLIEKIRGKRNNQKVEQWANAAGFAFLLLLMLLVTIKDVRGF